MKQFGVTLPESPLGRLPANQQVVIVTAIVVLVSLAVADRGIIKPLGRQQQILQAQLDTAHRQLAEIQRLRVVTRSLSDTQQRLPPRDATTQIIQEISTIADAERLTVNAVTPQPTTPLGRYPRLPIRIEAAGPYAHCLRFLKSLERASVPLRIDSLELIPATAGGSSTDEWSAATLQMRLTVSTVLSSA